MHKIVWNTIGGLILFVIFLAVMFGPKPFDSDKAIETAEKEGTPYGAYAVMDKLENDHFSGSDDNIYSNEPDDDYWPTKFKYLIEAAEGRDARSYPLLYNITTAPVYYPYEVAKLLSDIEKTKKKIAPRILEEAKTTENSNILVTAAQIISEGELTIRDANLALQYLARAWTFGDTQAANKSGVIYYELKDYENAYLWALRCIGECNRDTMLDLALLEKLLPADVPMKIQKLAQQKEVFNVPK